MHTVALRELNHHMSKYMNMVKEGERLLVTDHNIPIAEIVPHRTNSIPSWKKPFIPIKIKGEPASKTIIRMRREGYR